MKNVYHNANHRLVMFSLLNAGYEGKIAANQKAEEAGFLAKAIDVTMPEEGTELFKGICDHNNTISSAMGASCTSLISDLETLMKDMDELPVEDRQKEDILEGFKSRFDALEATSVALIDRTFLEPDVDVVSPDEQLEVVMGRVISAIVQTPSSQSFYTGVEIIRDLCSSELLDHLVPTSEEDKEFKEYITEESKRIADTVKDLTGEYLNGLDSQEEILQMAGTIIGALNACCIVSQVVLEYLPAVQLAKQQQQQPQH